ncbi:MAG: rod shape-determining protein MreD [Tenuifilaceae bacterium]|nr:rod shape-determining protein MreD [Tenuifilaceae bacterium]
MAKEILKYIGLFVLLLTLQVFLFNNIQLSGYINPYVYILFILLLPYETPGWLLLGLGLVLGICVDSFMNTYGMHSSATLLLAFLRPCLLNLLANREDVDRKGSPSIYPNGFTWFFKYAFFLVLAHHFMLFFIESFSFATFFHTMLRVILSTIVTTSFILLSTFLFSKK